MFFYYNFIFMSIQFIINNMRNTWKIGPNIQAYK